MTNNLNLVFYDTETTGIQKDFSQILQCGSVLTNSSLDTLDEQNIGCAPLPWVIPQPMAMITNKKIDLFNSNISHYQMMKDLQLQWKEWSAQNPSIFITYNGHAFDEELVNHDDALNLHILYGVLPHLFFQGLEFVSSTISILVYLMN